MKFHNALLWFTASLCAAMSAFGQPDLSWDEDGTGQFQLSWSVTAETWILEQTPSLTEPIVWEESGNPDVAGGLNTLTYESSDLPLFWRLRLDEKTNILAFGTGSPSASLDISVPIGTASATITGLPTNGTITLSDGTPVSTGTLSTADLRGLKFVPDPEATIETSSLAYELVDGGGTVTPSILLLNLKLSGGSGSGFLMAGYTPQKGFSLYSVDQGEATLVDSEIDGRPIGQSSSGDNFGLQELVSLNGVPIFNMQTGGTAVELWKYEGEEFLQLLGQSGFNSPGPEDLHVLGNRVYFIAELPGQNDFVHWTDGQTVQRVDDGTDPAANNNTVEDLMVLDGTAYAVKEDGNWWKIDGDEMIDTEQFAYEYESGGAVINNKFYSDGRNYEMYEFDGTTSKKVTSLGGPDDADVFDFHPYGTNVIFYADNVNEVLGLYMYDGTESNLIANGATAGVEFGGLYYYSFDGDTGVSPLWSWDGSNNVQQTDAPFEDNKGNMGSILSTGSECLISWKPTTGDSELWTFNGTDYSPISVPAGFNGLGRTDNYGRIAIHTSADQVIVQGNSDYLGSRDAYVYRSSEKVLEKLLADGTANEDGRYWPELVPYDGGVYFSANDGTGIKIYLYGKGGGTLLSEPTGGVADINISQGWQVIEDKLYYYSQDSANGGTQRGLWSWDGSTATFEDPGLRPGFLLLFDGKLRQQIGPIYKDRLITASSNFQGAWLKASTSDNAFDTYGPFAGSDSPAPFPFVVGNFLYMFATDTETGRELWKFDNSATPTLVEDYYPGADGFFNGLDGLASIGNTFYWINRTGEYWEEDTKIQLFKADDAAVTLLVDGDNVSGLFAWNNTIYFTADDGNGESQIYQLDGSTRKIVTPLQNMGLVVAWEFYNGADREFAGDMMLWDINHSLYSFDGTDLTLIYNFLYDPYLTIAQVENRIYFLTDGVDPETDAYVGAELFVWDKVAKTYSLAADINTTEVEFNYGGLQTFTPNPGEAAGLILRGGKDDDILVSAGSDDTMTGGLGSDRFVFGSSWGRDQITDFKIGVDLIDLSGTGLSYGDLTRAQLDSTTEFYDGQGNKISLPNVNKDDITEADFKF